MKVGFVKADSKTLILTLVESGNGIINADGDLWKIQRKAGLRFFSNANLKALIDNVLPPIVADTERTLDEAAQNGIVVDLQTVLLELTTRLMGNMAYDVRCIISHLSTHAFRTTTNVSG